MQTVPGYPTKQGTVVYNGSHGNAAYIIRQGELLMVIGAVGTGKVWNKAVKFSDLHI